MAEMFTYLVRFNGRSETSVRVRAESSVEAAKSFLEANRKSIGDFTTNVVVEKIGKAEYLSFKPKTDWMLARIGLDDPDE